MKKFVLICGLIVTIMMVTTVCFAKQFSDIKSTKFEDAVNVLTTLSIVDGYEDGTYRPNNDVTRAEMAKLIIVTLGKETAANSLKGKTQFNDVVEGGWASGYINCAVSQNIIKGYPEGSFKPNNKVTYAEAATMLLRALNYTAELENESYPTGYMKVANNAGILKDVQATKSSDNATRGFVAVMIFNTLKTPTRKIVSTTTTGKVNYGDGLSLVEVNFSNIKCVRDGEVIEVDFDEQEITIRDKTNNRKVTFTIKEEDELRKLYLRKVDVIYNDKDKEIISLEITDSYTIKEIEIEKIKSDTIYDKNDNEYELPDEDYVLFQYITKYDEAETAYITYDGKKIVCVILEGTPTVYAGIVTDNSITVSKSKGIEVLETDNDYHEYAYADSSIKVKVDDVILFSLNNDDEIIIRDRIVEKDAGVVQSISGETMTVKMDKKTKELPKDAEYYVYLVSTSDTIKEAKLKDIEKEFDQVYLTSISDIYYIVDFEDSVDADDVVSTLSVTEAKEQLESTLKSAKKKISKESSYSVETFEPFRKAYYDALDAYEGISSAAKLEILNRKLKLTMEELSDSNKDDKTLRKAYDELQSVIEEAESKKSSDYTTDSFKTLTTELKNARAVSIDNTTITKIETRTDALRKAINMLVTIAAEDEMQRAINEFKGLISTAENRIKNKSDYTDASIKRLETALNNANKFKPATATIAEIKNQISNLEAAIDALVLKIIGNYETVRKKLTTNYDDIMSIVNTGNIYTKESYDKFVKERDAIYTVYKALPTIDEVSKMTASQVSSETTKVNNLITRISNAKKLLVSSKVQAAKDSLQTLIDTASEIKEADWHNVNNVTYSQLRAKITNYGKLVTSTSSTLDQLNDAISDLSVLIALNK